MKFCLISANFVWEPSDTVYGFAYIFLGIYEFKPITPGFFSLMFKDYMCKILLKSIIYFDHQIWFEVLYDKIAY